MCDNNEKKGIQWNKAVTTAREVKHVTNTIMAHFSNSAGISPTATRLPHLCDNVLPKTVAFYGDENTYATAAAHFQTPVIHHSGILPVITSSANTVTGSSGFVAPFPASNTSSAVTTVLSSFSNIPSNAPTAIPCNSSHYGLEQIQQQMELNKIISAVNTQHASSVHAPLNAITARTISHTKTLNNSIITSGHTDLPVAIGAESSSGNINGKNNEIISSVLAEKVLSAISATPNVNLQTVAPATHGRLMGIGVVREPDLDKLHRIQHVVGNSLSEHAKQQIAQILERISTLRPVEKLLLYLRLPGDVPETDPLRQPQNPLGTRTEINHTINWVRTHLEHDSQVSIPKQDVYDDYLVYCERLQIKPLSTADFGKVMKQVFPGIRPRRLGTRGHSRYCYAAMRKTVNLTAPQIPTLQKSEIPEKREQQHMLGEASNIQTCDSVSWSIIQTWAEQILQTKIGSMQELVASINSQKQNKSPAAQKKRILTTQRELKEKRSLSDVGPVKKRRKKKRKGSSSSDSSSNCFNNNNNSNGYNNHNKNEVLSHLPSISENDHKLTTTLKYNTLNIKQEIVESTTSSPGTLQNQQQYQQMPINLVTDQRSVLEKMSVVGSPQQITDLKLSMTGKNIRSPAARNVTPKIMELACSTTTSAIAAPTVKEEVVDDYSMPTIYCKKVLKAHQTKGIWVNSPITQQVSTTVSSTVTTNTAVPTITTTSGSVALSGGVIMGVSEATASSNLNPPIQHQQQYLMGPPAHMANSISTSPLAVLSDNSGQTLGGNINNAGPKVASRNMLLLRAKRQIAMAAAAAAQASTTISTTTSNTVVDVLNDDKEGAELPENLGLPRERVISICNMDKHELDDYFLPGQDEEETQEEQDTELLQYFQTGDAEEKINSLDANKTNPTTTDSTNTDGFANVVKQTTNELTSSVAKRSSTTVITTSALTPTLTSATVSNNKSKLLPITNTCSNKTDDRVEDVVGARQLFASSGELVAGHESSAATKTIKPTVGSASASLALLSQKHQEQLQYQQMYNKHCKINKNNHNNNFFDKDDILNTARKNRIFLPISPNTKAVTSICNQSSTSTTTGSSAGGFFASPWLIANITSTLLSKQPSLDSDNCSDPMIGANRRKRSFMASSASAPPSPSIFQEQRKTLRSLNPTKILNQEFIQREQHQQPESDPHQQHCLSAKNGNSDVSRLNNILCFQNDVIDQNSIDLDLFEPLAHDNTPTKNVNNDILCNVLPNVSESNRSQSVPLLQLQRVISPFVQNDLETTPMSLYNSASSVPQTPLPLNEYHAAYTDPTTEIKAKALNGIADEIQLEESSVVASDSTALLDDVDCTVMLSSPELLSKFDCIAHTTATSITCSSSATSSSGYCSGAYSSTISRSVPSTPLPHHQHSFGSYYSNMGRKGAIDDYLQLSPTFVSGFSGCANTSTFKYNNSSGVVGTTFTGCGYDISKSMPTTPITTPCFRYSPTEFSRDFLINGNTLDSHHNFSTGRTNTETDLRAKSSNDLVSVGMNVDSLIFNEGINEVSLETLVNTNDSEGIMVGATLLDDF